MSGPPDGSPVVIVGRKSLPANSFQDLAAWMKDASHPIRVAITGRTVGLPLFESVELLGRERTLARIARAQDLLERGVD